MTAINFEVKNNAHELLEILKCKGYKRIGHIKNNPPKYFCILINRRQYFEISRAANPDIRLTDNMSDIKTFC